MNEARQDLAVEVNLAEHTTISIRAGKLAMVVEWLAPAPPDTPPHSPNPQLPFFSLTQPLVVKNNSTTFPKPVFHKSDETPKNQLQR